MLTLLPLKYVTRTSFCWLRCSESYGPQLLITRLPLFPHPLKSAEWMTCQMSPTHYGQIKLSSQHRSKWISVSVHSLKSQIDSQQQNKIKCLGLHYPWASGSHANGRSQIRSLTATAFSLMHEISYSHLAVTVRRKKKILKHLLSTWLQHAWQPIRSLTMCMMIVPLFKSAFFH